jgi:hypothetical protein
MPTDEPTSLRAALQPSALRAALIPERPVFANPWDKTVDMFACYVAVSFLVPLLLWSGGKAMGQIFSFTSHWKLGVFIAAAVVGAAGFMTIVGRERTRIAVDVLAITGWFLLGFVVAPIIGLDLSTAAAIVCYAVLLVLTLGYVVAIGVFERGVMGFITTLTWPVTWSLLAVFFAFTAYRLVLFT